MAYQTFSTYSFVNGMWTANTQQFYVLDTTTIFTRATYFEITVDNKKVNLYQMYDASNKLRYTIDQESFDFFSKTLVEVDIYTSIQGKFKYQATEYRILDFYPLVREREVDGELYYTFLDNNGRGIFTTDEAGFESLSIGSGGGVIK